MEIVFESDRISFVKLSNKLIDDYLAMINDIENVAKYLAPNPVTYSKNVELEWVDAQLKSGAHVYSMLDKSSNEFIGNIELRNIKDLKAELGVSITKAQQEKGYGKEAIKAIVRYGYDVLGVKQLYLYVFPFNSRAISVYKKCGFEIKDNTKRGIYMEHRLQ